MTEYATIVADPPWKYTKNPTVPITRLRGGTAENHYPTMRSEDIAALPIVDLAAPDAHLYMWVTNPAILQARPGTFGDASVFDICRAWGFVPKTILTWVKTNADGGVHGGGMGWFFRGATEHVLYATRGRGGIAPGAREPNVVHAPKGRHSAKPDAFMELVERVSPGPYLELFARRARPGWSVWGNEVECDLEIAA